MEILVLEASTSSAKAMVYDGRRGVVAMDSCPYPAHVNDVVTHDAQGELEILLGLGKRMAAGRDIAAISLVGTWHSLMLADRDMRPYTPIYTWAYRGAAQVAGQLRRNQEQTAALYQKTGCMVHAMYPAYKLMKLQQDGQVGRETRVCSQADYIFYCLTGEWAVSQSIASGTALLNIHSLAWDEEMLELAGIGEGQLPPVRPHTYTAPLCALAARELGLSPGIPVAVGNADGALNQVGAGAMREGVMTLSVGTSGALRMAVEAPVIPEIPSTWCYYAPGKWLSGAATNGATNCVDWFLQQTMQGRAGFAEMEAQMPEDTLDFPVFLPFLYGERCPGWQDERSGAFCGVKGNHGAGHFYRAVLEGVLFNLYHCYQILTEVGGTPEKICVSGGILNSLRWTQMLSDIVQRELDCPEMEQASMMGGAAVGLLVAGALTDLQDFQLKEGKKVYPDVSKRDFYEQRFGRYLEYYRQ
ncbi:MAG: gluconokinase [Christensenellales bacterium]|jgi:gluconokinase